MKTQLDDAHFAAQLVERLNGPARTPSRPSATRRSASRSRSLDRVQEAVHGGRAGLSPLGEAVAASAPVIGRYVNRLRRPAFHDIGLQAPARQRAALEHRDDCWSHGSEVSRVVRVDDRQARPNARATAGWPERPRPPPREPQQPPIPKTRVEARRRHSTHWPSSASRSLEVIDPRATTYRGVRQARTTAVARLRSSTSRPRWAARPGAAARRVAPREPERDAAIYPPFHERHRDACGSAVEALDRGGEQQRLGASACKTLRLLGFHGAGNRPQQPARGW
jgi:hypothetical protein